MEHGKWVVEYSPEVTDWLNSDVDSCELTAITSAIRVLKEFGPALGRPVVDTIKGSKYKNMKELRPRGTHIRILFIFNKNRIAVLLVGGSKEGQWKSWYNKNIPLAEKIYERKSK